MLHPHADVCGLLGAAVRFAEHAVTVEYCDFVPSASSAHVRLKCPEDQRLFWAQVSYPYQLVDRGYIY